MGSVPTSKQIDNIAPGESLAAGADKINQHWHNYDAVELTNRTGAQRVSGDVVALDTANDSSVVSGDVVGSLRPFVVAQATIANTAVGEFARSGLIVAKSTGAILKGEYIRKSATANAVETTGVTQADQVPPPVGSLGVATVAAAGGFVTAHFYGRTVDTGPLDRSGTDVPWSNTAAEQTLYSLSIKGGTLSTKNKVTLSLRGFVNGRNVAGADTLTWRFKYGATTLVTFTQQLNSVGPVRLNTEPYAITVELMGHNATNAQTMRTISVMRESVGGSIVPVSPGLLRGTATEDSTADKTLAVTVQFSFADANNNVTNEHALTGAER
jgi:hypothetical protein